MTPILIGIPGKVHVDKAPIKRVPRRRIRETQQEREQRWRDNGWDEPTEEEKRATLDRNLFSIEIDHG
jgi:hypothetical protein